MGTNLRAENLRMEFGTLLALHDVSFELEGGQLLGLVGPNGAGKTTLLRICAGLQAPTGGRAFVLDCPVLGEHEVVRHHIGFAPDAPPAYEEITIQQFLRFIGGAYGLRRGETDERIDFWLEQLWLTEKREIKIKELSRGMRQRVTLARTFLPRPHVLLLDEPLAGLDPAGRIQLRNVLTMLCNQGCSLIVSSHILSDLEEVSTHIAIIEHGGILQWSQAGNLEAKNGNRQTYQLVSVDDLDAHLDRIKQIDGVDSLRVEGRTCTFDFHATENEAAGLLRTLIEDDMAIASFRPIKTTLEEVYLRSGVKQVD